MCMAYTNYLMDKAWIAPGVLYGENGLEFGNLVIEQGEMALTFGRWNINIGKWPWLLFFLPINRDKWHWSLEGEILTLVNDLDFWLFTDLHGEMTLTFGK